MTQPPKNPGLAVILSFFFMGLGQFYNGQFGKGILFIIFYGISIGLMFVLLDSLRLRSFGSGG